MISHKHKFIFIHIPNTAGTSIEKALYDESCQLLPGEWDYARARYAPLNHLTLQELVDSALLTPAQLQSYFKFCFVRNPWDRLVSEIFSRWMSPWFKDLAVEDRIRRGCEWAATGQGIGNHLRPQQDFVGADGLCMDFIGRFEHLAEDFSQICRRLGVDATLPHLNRSAHRPYQEHYDAATQALVAATYRRDIDAFHYQFEEHPVEPRATRPLERQMEQPAKEDVTRRIAAYPLFDHPAHLQPATGATAQAQSRTYKTPDFVRATRQGWQVCCPVAFSVTWNGGPKAEDIELHMAADAAAPPAFVQSNLGNGLLTFYPGYQFKTEKEHLLWVRGPINAPKDGLAPLESMVDASVLPCTIVVQWQFTRPHQTIHFAAGEPFATLLLYPKTKPEALFVETYAAPDGQVAAQ